MGSPPGILRQFRALIIQNWKLSVGVATSLTVIVSIYLYSAQITDTQYQTSEYLKEHPEIPTTAMGGPFDMIKALGYLGLAATMSLLVFRYLMNYPWFQTFVEALKRRF
ncbi:hypothetical protein JXL21_10205 [Candidatus Bathyarchaeota archaeon]|nr:hypothetical protein [Candidatus Bathyarchaeota archaeon]